MIHRRRVRHQRASTSRHGVRATVRRPARCWLPARCRRRTNRQWLLSARHVLDRRLLREIVRDERCSNCGRSRGGDSDDDGSGCLTHRISPRAAPGRIISGSPRVVERCSHDALVSPTRVLALQLANVRRNHGLAGSTLKRHNVSVQRHPLLRQGAELLGCRLARSKSRNRL